MLLDSSTMFQLMTSWWLRLVVETVQKYDCHILFSPWEFRRFERTRHQPFLNRLGEICIPNVKEVFTDLMLWDPEERISNKRERVMAKILVDVYMLCNLVERHNIRNDNGIPQHVSVPFPMYITNLRFETD